MTPVNTHATENAKKLLEYLSEIGGQKIITGQHTQTVPMEEVQEIKHITGRTPRCAGLNCWHILPTFAMRRQMRSV